MYLEPTLPSHGKKSKDRLKLRIGATITSLLTVSALTGCTDTTKASDFDTNTRQSSSSTPMRMGNFAVITYNVHDLTLKTAKGKHESLAYINTLVDDPNAVVALQEVRGIAKARWLKDSLNACNNPEICELNMFMPENDGSSMPFIWHNDRFEIVPEDSISRKLHDELTPENQNGNKIKINQKWVTVVVLKDKLSGGKVALINVHLARDYQTTDGDLNTKAPEILDVYYDEMRQIEEISQHYLDLGYSAIINGDTNFNHNYTDMPDSPASKLKEIGFTNIYHNRDVVDLTPKLQSTHRDILTNDDSGNIDAIYLANPNNPTQPLEFKIVWRKNLGPAPSDHNAVAAGISATDPR